MTFSKRKILAYIVGVAMGDGNLSNPNGRATRLRITCDTKYKNLIRRICDSIQILLPDNKVTIIRRAKTYIDVSCYSNQWEKWLGWKVGKGSKYSQQISIPEWIQKNEEYTIHCLRGLIETDGSIYHDRSYKMINFVTMIPKLAFEVLSPFKKLGFDAHLYENKSSRQVKTKYTIRLSKEVISFIKLLNLSKN